MPDKEDLKICHLPDQVSRCIERARDMGAEPIERDEEVWVWVENCDLNDYLYQESLPLLIREWQVRILLDQPSDRRSPNDKGLYVNTSDLSLYQQATAEIREQRESPSELYRELIAAVGEEEKRAEYLETEGKRLLEKIEEIAAITREKTIEGTINEALQKGKGFWYRGAFYITYDNVPQEDADILVTYLEARGLAVITTKGAKNIRGKELPNYLCLYVDLDQTENYYGIYGEYLRDKRLAEKKPKSKPVEEEE